MNGAVGSPVRRSGGTPGRLGLASPVLLALAALDAAGYSLIGPVLPELAVTTGASPRTLGWLVASFPLTMLLGFVLATRLIRRTRRETVFLVGLALQVVGCVAFVVSEQIGVLFAGRMVMGLGSGVLWIAVTFRTLEYWPDNAYRCMARVTAAYSVGALVGPLLGGLHGAHLPFVGYLVLLLAAVPATLLLPAPATELSTTSDWSALRLPGFWFAALAVLFAMMAPGILDGVLPIHFATAMTQTQIALAYAATAVLVALAATGAGHLRPVLAVSLGGVAMVVGLAVAAATSTVAAWLPALALAGLGAGATETGSAGVLLEAVPTDRIVTAMVVWSQVGMLGYLLAPALGAPLAQEYGFAAVGLVPLAAGLLVVVAGVVSRGRSRALARHGGSAG